MWLLDNCVATTRRGYWVKDMSCSKALSNTWPIMQNGVDRNLRMEQLETECMHSVYVNGIEMDNNRVIHSMNAITHATGNRVHWNSRNQKWFGVSSSCNKQWLTGGTLTKTFSVSLYTGVNYWRRLSKTPSGFFVCERSKIFGIWPRRSSFFSW